MLDSMNSDHLSDNKKPPKKHIWIMLICCLAPLFGIVALSSFGIIGSWGFFALILLCPILHFFIMKAISQKKVEPPENRDRRRADD